MQEQMIFKGRSKAPAIYAVVALYGSCFLFLLGQLQLDELVNGLDGTTCFGCSGTSSDRTQDSERMHTRSQRMLMAAPLGESVNSTFVERAGRLETKRDDDGLVLWESPPLASILPDWMKDYFAWHKESLKTLNDDHSKWTSYKYLVVRCLTIDHKCGGASDRLQSIPLALLLASQYHRLLFIEWERPAALTEFLQPTALDWRLPTWFHKGSNSTVNRLGLEHPYLHFQRSPTVVSDKHFSRLNRYSHLTVMDMRYQTHDHGRTYYNAHSQHLNEADFDKVYAAAWTCLFQPSRPVQALIEDTMTELGLNDGNFVSLHVRSMYYKDQSQKWSSIENAVNCAAQLGTKADENRLPSIYVASDSLVATQTAVEYGTSALGRRVVACAKNSSDVPLHLDRGSNFLSSSTDEANWMDFPGTAYYAVFVDLYLLSRARCVAYGVGSYGSWASLIGSSNNNNHSVCSINHRNTQCAV
jgi:hypothetical protein